MIRHNSRKKFKAVFENSIQYLSLFIVEPTLFRS